MKGLAEIRQENPQYDDMNDAELSSALHKKFYSDMPYREFAQKIGYEGGVLKDYAEPQEETPLMDTILGSEVGNLALGLTDVTAIGPAQLGANIGDLVEGVGPYQVETEGLEDGIELTDYSKQRYLEQGVTPPQPYHRDTGGDYANKIVDAIHASKERGRAARGATGTDYLGIAGMLPAGAVKFGGEAIARHTPEVVKALAEKAPQWMQRAGKTAGMGAAYSTGVPVQDAGQDFGKKKMQQAGLAAFIGFLGSSGYQLSAAGVNKARDIYKGLFTEKGMIANSEEWIRKMAGEDAPKFIDAMQNVQKKMSGNAKPTVADALAQQSRIAEKAGRGDTYGSHMIRTQDDLAKVGNRLDSNARQANIDMKNILARESMTPADIKAAEAARTTQASIDYAKDVNKLIPLASNKTKVAQAIQQAQDKQAGRLASKGSALQDKGRFQTMEAQAATQAKDRIMPSGEVRVPSRYAPTAKLREDAGKAADYMDDIIAKRQTQVETHASIEASLVKSAIGADSKALTNFMSRPSFIEALQRGKNLAAEGGHKFASNIDKGITVGDLQIINRAIKQGVQMEQKLIASGQKGTLTDAENQAIMKTGKELTDFLRSKSSGFRAAEDAYIKASEPIGRAKVAAAQVKQLFPKLDKKTPETFVKSIDDPKFYNKETGGFKSTLEETFPKSAAARRQVADVLEDEAHKQTLSKLSDSMLKKVDGQLELSLPRILSRPVVVANHALKWLTKRDIEPKMHSELSKIFSDPQRFKRILENPAMTQEKSMVMEILKKMAITSSSQQAGRAVGE